MYPMSQKIIFVVTIFALLILVWGQSFEGFENPTVASSEDIEGGSSEYYNWGYKEIPDDKEEVPHTRHHCPRCRKSCYIPVPYKQKKYPCPHCQTKIHIKNDFYFVKGDCDNSDITRNKNINKYVLKSSVPACPDMSQYAKKSQLRPNGNGGGGNGGNGGNGGGNGGGGNGGRGENCPKCPICPICPKCPEPDKMRRHPDDNKYTLRNDYNISSENRMGQTDFGIGGDEEPGPGYKTGSIPNAPGIDLGLGDNDVARKGTTPKAGATPDPYFKDFAYNNRSTGRVKAYNSVWNVFG